MACLIIVLDKHPGVILVGIRETPRRALAKIVLGVAGDQAKVTYGNIQVCTGLEAGI